jgi:predicted nucleic acid-binding protein
LTVTLAFDSSGLVRRYDASEPGSALVASLCSQQNDNVVIGSRLVRLEVLSAFQRKQHEGTFTPERASRAWRNFRADEDAEYRFIAIDDMILSRAEALLHEHHPLRTADAIHVATALTVLRLQSNIDLVFVTADRRQANTAEAEGLAVQFIE